MPRRRPHPRLLAGCALLLASLPAVAAAQYAPGQYSPYPQAGPYQQPYPNRPYPQPGPYAQPLPYTAPNQAPGYQPLPGNHNTILSDRAHGWPILRFSFGAGAAMPREGELLPAFDLDIAGGYRFALVRRVYLAVEAGYSMSTEPTYGGHFGVLGAGPGVHVNRYLSIGWMPKLVLGETPLGLGVGVRNTLAIPLFFHAVSIELGHQWLSIEERGVHELRAQIGVDLAGVGHLAAWLIAGRRR